MAMSIREQAIQMINGLSEDDVTFLIDFIKRYMLPTQEDKHEEMIFIDERQESTDFMKELEDMRIRAKPYFLKDFDVRKI